MTWFFDDENRKICKVFSKYNFLLYVVLDYIQDILECMMIIFRYLLLLVDLIGWQTTF